MITTPKFYHLVRVVTPTFLLPDFVDLVFLVVLEDDLTGGFESLESLLTGERLTSTSFTRRPLDVLGRMTSGVLSNSSEWDPSFDNLLITNAAADPGNTTSNSRVS